MNEETIGALKRIIEEVKEKRKAKCIWIDCVVNQEIGGNDIDLVEDWMKKPNTSKLSQAQLEQALIDNYGYYPLTYLSKEDLEEMDFDTDKVNDETMKKISGKMTDIYLDNGFWEDMRLATEQLGVPSKE
jgi:hypothetical protein